MNQDKSDSELDSATSTDNGEYRHDFTSASDTTPKKRKIAKLATFKCENRKFRDSWLKEFKWLKNTKPDSALGQPYCIACGKSLKGSYTHLLRHANGNRHKVNIKAHSHTPSISSALSAVKDCNNSYKNKITEYKCIAFITEHNLPISLMDHLPQFLKSACPDSKYVKEIKCGRTKTTQICKQIFMKENLSELSQTLQTRSFSLIIDETTDISVAKSLVVLVRYFDDYKVTDNFLGLIELETATAQAITDKILELLNTNNIPIKNLVGLAADNATVMMGHISGVQARLKRYVPDLFVIGCSCHSLHLCASAACTQLPRALEQFTRDIYNHFSNSSERCNQFKEFQEFVNIKPNKLLRPSQTRWLSLKQVVDKIILNWPALKLYFDGIVLKPENSRKTERKTHLHHTESIYNALHNQVYELYFLFLRYILDVILKLNLQFQAESSQITTLYDSVSKCYKFILGCFVDKDFLNSSSLSDIDPRDTTHHKPSDEMYFGANFEEFLSRDTVKLTPTEIKDVKKGCLQFYVELAVQIRNRFDFNNKLLRDLTMLCSENVQTVKSITKIVSYFPNVKHNINLEEINIEWRSIDFSKITERQTEKFWSDIVNNKNVFGEFAYPNLRKLISTVLALPHSSAAAERIFSQLTLIKTKIRNRLSVKTSESLLHTKYYISKKSNSCFNFTPNESILKRNLVYETGVESDEQEQVDNY